MKFLIGIKLGIWKLSFKSNRMLKVVWFGEGDGYMCIENLELVG